MSLKSWIIEKLKENELDSKKVRTMYQSFIKDSGSISSEKSFQETVSRLKGQLERGELELADEEVVRENVRLSKQLQKQQDLNRIKNKSYRESSRIENALVEYSEEIINILKKYDLSCLINNKDPFVYKSDLFGVVNIADTHFNEMITPFEGNLNSYDFKIASKRLRLFAEKIKRIFKSYGVKNVVIAFLGDLLNSNRRIEELLASSTNRSKATLLASFLLEQFIIDLSKDYSLILVSVTGNESRINEIHEWSDLLVTENFDYTIFNILKIMFRGVKSVNFIEGDYKEQIITLNGFNILILHGENIKTEKDVQLLMGKYQSQGVQIHHIMTGHYHAAKISDYSSRSSSLCGSNAYSNRSLGLISKASQNIHIIDSKLKLIDSMKLDLQIIDEVEGYNIDENLEAYNAKSLEKTKIKKTILEVIL